MRLHATLGAYSITRGHQTLALALSVSPREWAGRLTPVIRLPLGLYVLAFVASGEPQNNQQNHIQEIYRTKYNEQQLSNRNIPLSYGNYSLYEIANP